MKKNLGVNIDHIATIREARKIREPDPVSAAILAELAGANGLIAFQIKKCNHLYLSLFLIVKNDK